MGILWGLIGILLEGANKTLPMKTDASASIKPSIFTFCGTRYWLAGSPQRNAWIINEIYRWIRAMYWNIWINERCGSQRTCFITAPELPLFTSLDFSIVHRYSTIRLQAFFSKNFIRDSNLSNTEPILPYHSMISVLTYNSSSLNTAKSILQFSNGFPLQKMVLPFLES